ncbi:type II secretion system protein [Planctobacterium marinum]|uniref:type II secretion system protein n=1 Tax=Planctobacterium marinum TaxID=1631968 RepID=UPI00226CD866|nr:type II secretion system protein [Planctobacterium marinum]MCC2606158.1 type II secretion system GspH family protein [Planctobacterium marinum]
MQRSSGFTLIELLIVITISAMAISLVGGLTIDSITKFKAKAEQIRLKSFLRQSSHQAFIHEKQLTVKSTANSLRLLRENKSVHILQFEYLTFQDGELHINPAGFFSGSQLSYVLNGRRITLGLQSL